MRTAAIPSKTSAWRIEPTVCGRGEEGRVDVAQEAVAQAHVADHQPLEAVEVGVGRVQLGEQGELGQAVGRHAAPGHDLRLAEELPLEVVEAQAAAEVQLLVGLHVLGHELQPPPLEQTGLPPQPLLAEGPHVQLHHVREAQRLLVHKAGNTIV